MRGYLLEHPEVVEAMDVEIGSSSTIIPAAFKKDGTFTKRSKVLASDDLQMMRSYVRTRHQKAGNAMLAGDTRVYPYKLKDKMPCQFCPYRSVCQFDPTDPAQEYRKYEALDADTSLEKMRKEVAEMMNIPVKPEGLTFTDEQWKAIWASGRDILVSAAAGSGKTKVLITRMIEKVINEKNPIDVDELLVVTFTNAAAAEMRHRMAEALEEAIAENPDSVHLRRQLNLLNKAQISTLHSFCQNVVRQYAYLLDIDPGFRIADSTEAALLRDDTIGEVLEEAYSAENPEAIYRLADSFTSDRDDQLIETLISRLYDYSRVHPSPEKWLRLIPEQYEIAESQFSR